MARRQRSDFEGAVHHVMNRGVNRQPIFFSDADRVEFGNRLADIHDRLGVETLAYCLMDNHFHLILRTPDAHLSEAMQRLSSVFTQQVNRRLNRDGPLFRGRFHSILVTTDNYLRSATRYIHRNPLDIAGINNLADYRWASYRTFLGLRPPPTFVNVDPVFGLHNRDRDALVTFTERPRSWIDVSRGLKFEALVEFVQFAVARDDLLHASDDSGAVRWQTRTILVLLMERLGAHPIAAAIDQELGFPSSSARSKAIRRAQRRLATGTSTARVLDYVLSELTIGEPATAGEGQTDSGQPGVMRTITV